ncbi:EEF1A lysine methyltransferase 1 isoform X2 [Colletes latitarsis]|uniref:EEF1A lysine methyltransferase 1 isoform X2 n=1 Tax=Colletes latitarsis TaxID=2605962 RepID=UPI0040352193
MSDSDDNDLELCPTTLAALNEFLKEKEEKENQFKSILGYQSTDVSFDENWQLSQFWYDDQTTDTLVKGAINSTETNGKIALISCPTLYSKLKKKCSDRQVTLFEYDERFKVFGSDFIPYNYKFPLDVPRDMSGAVMAELAGRLLDVTICNFIPRHRNNLANEFYCYSNFDFDKMLK